MRDDTPHEVRRAHLSRTFDEDAELYDRARPGYPSEVFDDLAKLAGIGPGCRVLEVGAGTGKATSPLAERGCRITAVELGADMAAVARRNLAGFESVEIVTADFETWPLPGEPLRLSTWRCCGPTPATGPCRRRPGGTAGASRTAPVPG
jgi:ubiquinone/menaquinone biosynthesis C-methylase UbiE